MLQSAQLSLACGRRALSGWRDSVLVTFDLKRSPHTREPSVSHLHDGEKQHHTSDRPFANLFRQKKKK